MHENTRYAYSLCCAHTDQIQNYYKLVLTQGNSFEVSIRQSDEQSVTKVLNSYKHCR